MKTVYQLIRGSCANYDGHSNGILNYCCLEKEETNMQCGYFKNDTYRCGYFEKCVLPIDKQTEAIYYAEREAKKEGKELSSKDRKEIKEENKVEKKKRKRRSKFEMKLG